MRISTATHRALALAIPALLLGLAFGCGSSGSSQSLGGPAPEVGTPITAGQVQFVNGCAVGLTLLLNGSSLGVLAASGGTMSVPITQFNQGNANVVMPYPNL